MATSYIGPYSPEYYKKNTLAIPQLGTANKTSTVPYAVKPVTTIPSVAPVASGIPNASALTLNIPNIPTGNAASTAPVYPMILPSTISTPYVPPSSNYLTAGQYGAPVLPQGESTASPTPTPIPTPVPDNSGQISDIQGLINSTKDALDTAKSQLASMQSSGSSSPSVISSAQAAITTAENAYKEALKLSPDEITTQEDLDKLIEATKKSYLNIKGQAIPMEFITGQLKSVEERALGMAEPLERKLARMQAQRTAATETSKFSLERADKSLAAERSAETEAAKIKREESQTVFSQQLATSNYNLSEKKFEEDKRQFGLDYAINQREMAVKEAESAAKTAEKTTVSESAKSEAANSYQLVTELLSSNKLGPISGKISSASAPLIGGLLTSPETKLAQNQLLQLKGILSLENRQKLKGQGQISDYEGKLLANAASSLGISDKGTTGISETELRRQLTNVRAAFALSVGEEVPAVVISPEGESLSATINSTEASQLILEGNTITFQ